MTELNLVQKLAKIRTLSDAVVKEKKGYNYNYADITTILAKVTAGMKRYGVSLIPQIVPGTAEVKDQTIVNTKFDKTGKPYDQTLTEMVVTADMVFKWVNDENPEEFIEVPWYITGAQSDPSQAFGSGLTYCTRYFLCNYFQIAQPDTDVDTYRSKQHEAEEAENRALAEEIVAQIDSRVKAYIAANHDKTEDMKNFISKYARNANYLAIKEPNLAAKLLQDLEKYIGGEEINKEKE